MFERIIKWWIYEIDIQVSGDYSKKEVNTINYDEALSMNIEFIKNNDDIVLTGSYEYYNIYKKTTQTDI